MGEQSGHAQKKVRCRSLVLTLFSLLVAKLLSRGCVLPRAGLSRTPFKAEFPPRLRLGVYISLISVANKNGCFNVASVVVGRPDNTDDSRHAANALAQIRHPDSVAALMKVTLTTSDSDVRHHARTALGNLTGVSFSHEPNETIAAWWALNREHYLRPLPEKK